MAEQWMSIVEYARAYRMSDMTVRRRIKTGKLRAILKEGKYFIPVDLAESRSAVQAPQQQAHASHQSHQSQPVHQGQSQSPYANMPPSQQMANANQGHRRPQVDGPLPLVMKGHLSSHKTFSMPHVEARAVAPEVEMRQTAADDFEAFHEAVIPQSLRRPLQNHEQTLVDTRALLAFCEASMRKSSDTERRTVERFKSKLEALEATLSGRDREIKMLQQKVEDLQLLINFIEKK